jgi:glycosyltransferase involved in cell wall biosynthesis
MLSDYPKDKIEWILVDDTDKPEEFVAERVELLKQNSAPLTIKYYQLDHHLTVGEKRNLGISYATNDIVLMMDDDDHYPETSFRRRVAWLTLHPMKPKATVCTTIACYDLNKAISAVNSPPLTIPFSERISEATLTFYKSWWEQKGFPNDIQVGEGEGFVHGREEEVLEIPPQQIIVAFSHGKNTSSRRIPEGADVNPGCFWGFPKEFLVFIHGLAGVKVQESRT